MKKYYISLIVIILTMSCFVSGCSNKKSSLADAAQNHNIGVVVSSFDDTWLTLVRNQLYDMAENNRTKIDIWTAENSQKLENEKVNNLIKRKVNVLAVNLVKPSAASKLVDIAKKADIPIVFFNIQPSINALKKWNRSYYVGAIGKKSGLLQGQILGSYFKRKPTKDGIIHYLMIKGENGNSDTIVRTKYSVKAMQDMGLKLEKTAEITASWQREKASQEVDNLLGNPNKRIDCIIANNDDMALGAIDALKEKAYFNKGHYMPVVGVDATSTAVNAIKSGTLLGTVLNDAKNQGSAIFKLANVLADGKTPSYKNCGYKIVSRKYIWIDYKRITKENIGDVK